MLQRIQTIYMSLAVVAMAACFLFPIATFDTTMPSLDLPVEGELRMVPQAASNIQEQMLNGEPVFITQQGFINVWPLVALLVLAALTTVVSVFMYKNRVRQMRFVMLPFLLCAIDFFLIFIWAVDTFVKNATTPLSCTEVHVTYGVGTWAVAVAMVLLYLAHRAIKKDEAKVRAADRLR